VTSVFGSVDWKTTTSAAFTPLQLSTQMVHVGDQVRTGPNSQLILTLPDNSYMVVNENSTLTIQDFWGSSVRNIVNVMMGRVRFYIQRFGGAPNPYQVQTSTALISVRGTTFDVIVNDPKSTEVACIEGVVAVNTLGLPDNEVVLEAGKHTLVQAGKIPVMPIAANEPLIKNRVIQVTRKDGDGAIPNGKNGGKSDDRLLRDNDRDNRTFDPLQSPRSINGATETQRAKPTLTFPPK
jgi:hypothetical protein